MEKGTKKVTKKVTKKTTAKNTTKQEPVVVEKIVEKETIDYASILNKIFYSLIVIIVLFVINLIINIVSIGEIKSTTTSNGTDTEESLGEYDVSMFKELNTTDAISAIKAGGQHIVYIGRATCGYCVKFLPVLEQAQEEFGYTTTYIDLEGMSSDDQTALLELDNEEGYISENFGYTPLVLVFKDGKLANGWVGYAEYKDFASFLEESGVKK